ncbi:alpha/beta hydrolase [Geodermatophilus sp. URMC 64]
MPTRRAFLLAGAAVLAGCGIRWPPPDSGGAAVLRARPAATVPEPGPLAEPGTHPLGLVRDRDPLLHVPPGLPPGRPAPLVVSLHGAGGDAAAGLGLLEAVADERGFLLLAPASRGRTWDAVGGVFGPDAALTDRALEQVFSGVPVDGDRLTVAGFSDGASYALGLGLANGDLFGRVIAFSPGFAPITPRTGRPEVFISHGTEDGVLPLAETSRRIVPALREDGYRVTYREFDGGHEVPPDIVREAADLLA